MKNLYNFIVNLFRKKKAKDDGWNWSKDLPEDCYEASKDNTLNIKDTEKSTTNGTRN